MRAGPQTVRIGYFGKLPSCADFIKVVDNLALAGLLDDWLTAVLNVLSAEPRLSARGVAAQSADISPPAATVPSGAIRFCA